MALSQGLGAAGAAIVPGPVTTAAADALDGEQQQERDQQREDAERFRQREAEEQRAALAFGRRGVAQRAGQELAEQVAEADARARHAEAGETGADVFAATGSMVKLLLMEVGFGREKRGAVSGRGEGRR